MLFTSQQFIGISLDWTFVAFYQTVDRETGTQKKKQLESNPCHDQVQPLY